MRHHGKQVLSQTAIYLLARGMPGLIAFLAIPLLSRMLEPQEYGRYALIIAVVNLLGAMLFQWMRLALVRFLPAYAHDEVQLKNTLLGTTAALAALLGTCVAVAWALPIDASWKPVLLACWIMLVAHAMFELCSEYTRAALRPWRYMVLQLLRSGVGLGAGVALVAVGWGWWGPIVGLTGGMTLGVMLAYRGDWRGSRLRVDLALMKRLAVYGVPVSLTVALICVMWSCDRLLIALMIGESAAGQYAAAVDLTAQTAGLLMMAVYMPLFPLAVHAWESDGRAAAQQRMRSNGAMQLAIGLPAVVGLSVLTPGIANCLLGEDFRAAAVALIPLAALSAFLAGLKAYHFDAAFQLAHRTMVQASTVLVAAGLNVVLNLLFIPRWGLPGAAIASVLAYAVGLAMAIVLGWRHVALPIPLGDVVRVVIATAAMALALWPFREAIAPLALTTQIVVGGAIYGALLGAMDFMGVREGLLRRLGLASTPRDVRDAAASASAAMVESG
jgi:O-antigen/teichoic acid export membrane protein